MKKLTLDYLEGLQIGIEIASSIHNDTEDKEKREKQVRRWLGTIFEAKEEMLRMNLGVMIFMDKTDEEKEEKNVQ